MILACFCWALPDPKYQYWLKQRLWLFYVAAGANSCIAAAGGATAFYFYYSGPALYSFLSAAVIIYLVIATGPLLVTIAISFAYV